MALALLYGAGSGALHAVTGPDHVLSLGPAALAQPRRSFEIGLRWGVGHALGTLLLGLPLLFVARLVELESLARFGDRLSALALIAMGAWSFWSLRRPTAHGATSDGRSPLLIGLVHGIGGAGSLMLFLPSLVTGSTGQSALFLLSFAFGSTLAMAGLTSTVARLGSRIARAAIPRAQRGLSSLSVAVGAALLVL